MTMPTPDDLATRIEQASGPDRELDVAIAAAFNVNSLPGATKHVPFIEMARMGKVEHRFNGGTSFQTAPPYTASIDAALTLLPEGWKVANLGQSDDGTWWAELRSGYITSYSKVALSHLKCATPALALLAACIRAHDGRGK